MVEYAAILDLVAGDARSILTSLDLTLSTILLIGGCVIFFCFFAFKA